MVHARALGHALPPIHAFELDNARSPIRGPLITVVILQLGSRPKSEFSDLRGSHLPTGICCHLVSCQGHGFKQFLGFTLQTWVTHNDWFMSSSWVMRDP